MTAVDNTATQPPPPAPRPPWGYVTALVWVVLAHVVASVVAIAAVMIWRPALVELESFTALMNDGWFLAISTAIAVPVEVGMLVFLAAMRPGWTASDYLAVNWPARQHVIVALIALVVVLPLSDLLAYLLGQPIVSPFQTDVYTSARASGVLPLLWLAIVVGAPVGEEIIFRGFLFRSWIRSARAALPGIVAIAALFAIIHVQYNWFGILQVFILGLLFTWARWRSGSVLLAILLHAITNFYSMLQTVAVLDWFR